jgi:hypothetical protein
LPESLPPTRSSPRVCSIEKSHSPERPLPTRSPLPVRYGRRPSSCRPEGRRRGVCTKFKLYTTSPKIITR